MFDYEIYESQISINDDMYNTTYIVFN